MGWHTYTLTSDTITINSPGTCWLCFQTDAYNNGNYRSKVYQTGYNYMFAQAYASGFQATFAASPMTLSYGDFSFYATRSP